MSTTDLTALSGPVPTTSGNVSVYELAYTLRVGESDSALKAVLSKFGATIVKDQPASQIQLAYPIKKQTTALFGFLHFTLQTPEGVQQISDALQLTDNVLRFIIVKMPSTRKARQSVARRERRDAPLSAPVKKSPGVVVSADRLSGLSNEKLSQTLEEILK